MYTPPIGFIPKQPGRVVSSSYFKELGEFQSLVKAHVFIYFLKYFLSIYLFRFLGLHLQHMEVPRLAVNSELQLPDHTTATPQDLSCVYDLHHSSQQRRIFNPLSKARDQICILTDASQVR